MRHLIARVLVLCALLAATAARSNDPYTFQDFSGTSHTVNQFGTSGNAYPLVSPADSSGNTLAGAIASPANSALTVQGYFGMSPVYVICSSGCTGAGGVSVTQNSFPWLTTPYQAGQWGVGATGSAVPTSAVYVGVTSGGNLTGWNGNVGLNAGTNTVGAVTQGSSAGNFGWLVNPYQAGQWSLGATGSSVPTSATYVGINSGGNLTGWNGNVGQSTFPWLATPYQAGQWGIGSTSAATPTSAVYAAGNAESSEPSKATAGNLTGFLTDLVGKLIISPYANRENQWRGAANTTGNAAVYLVVNGGSGVKTYVTSAQCGRTDSATSAAYVQFNDTSSTILVVPNSGSGGGNNAVWNVPLVTAANTSLTFTPSSSATTWYCDAQGFYGY